MTNSNTGWGCRQISWLAAAIIGVVAAIILGVAAHWGWFLAILAGIVVAVIAGLILTYFFCGEAAAPASSASTSSTPAAPEAPAPVAAAPAEPAPTAAPAAVPAAAPAAPAAQIKPSKALAGEEELASQKGDWKYEAPAAEPAKPAKKAAAKPAAKAAPKAEKAAKPAAKTTKSKATAAKARTPAADGGKPAALSAPRGGKADDLKVIEGIGPKLEELVNSYGVYHYDQIAAWSAEEVAWMDGNMPRFKGRVTRDKWVAQAKIIVEEGIEAFLERAKTNDY